MTIIVGENGCGKTTILDSIALSMLDYKAESFNIYDFNQLDKDVNIIFNSNEEFGVKGTMPNSDFKAIGFNFNAKLRNRTQKNYLLRLILERKSEINLPFKKLFSKFIIVFLLFLLNSFTKFTSVPLEILSILSDITLKKSLNLL